MNDVSTTSGAQQNVTGSRRGHWRDRMHDDLVVAGMAERTCVAYLRSVRLLSKHYNNADPSQLSEDQVKDISSRCVSRGHLLAGASPQNLSSVAA